MSSHVEKAKLYFCFDGEWVQHNDVWDFAYKSKHGVKLKVNITHQKLLAYAIEKCGIDSAVGETKLVYMNDGSIFELTDDGHVSDFMQFAFESDIPPALFVYVVPSMCNEGDDEGEDEGEDEGDDEGEDEGDDETHVGECSQFETSYDATFNPDHTFVPETQGLEEEEEVEVEDEGRRFVGVADDETHVFTVGISDFDNSDTDNDEEYVPSNKSFGELNDYFDMPPPLRTSETSIPTYQPAPYNRSSRIREGQMFETKDEMIIQLGIKCIEEGFERKVKKSDKERYVAVCAIKNCNWRFTARSVGAKGGMFHVTSLHDVHTCSRTQLNPNHRQADKRTLGHMLKGKFLDASRAFRPKDIMNDINDQYGITIGYHQSWRARCRALLLVRGTPEESYERLPTYLYNLELNNPGTRTRIRTDERGRFELCFAALGVAIRTFLTNLRRVVVIDAAHLKGRYLGMMFLAVAMDGNQNIVPIGFGVGKSETGEEWGWFLSMLRECIGEPAGLVFMSDRAPAISAAISAVYPNTPHALCCRHLEMNVKSKDKRITTYNTAYWKTCKAYTVREFDRYMNALRISVPIGVKVMDDAGKERWSRAHFPGARYNIMTSNSVESVNALSRFARRLPIVQLMEYFRTFQQEWYHLRRLKGG